MKSHACKGSLEKVEQTAELSLLYREHAYMQNSCYKMKYFEQLTSPIRVEPDRNYAFSVSKY